MVNALPVSYFLCNRQQLYNIKLYTILYLLLFRYELLVNLLSVR